MQLALGTVQFGLSYGISNRAGQIPETEAEAILDFARDSGIELLDTAAAYGTAEAVLSKLDVRRRGFSVISKTMRLSHGLAAVIARAHQSVQILGRPLEALLVHSAADLALPDGPLLWRAMTQLKADGLVRQLGISAYPNDPILQLAEKFAPDVMQVPVSLVDQRLVADGTLSTLAGWGVQIHARSLFHQGLIFLQAKVLPPKFSRSLKNVSLLLDRLDAAGHPRQTLALGFAKSVGNIAAGVVGVTSKPELAELVDSWRSEIPAVDYAAFAVGDPFLLDPTQW